MDRGTLTLGNKAYALSGGVGTLVELTGQILNGKNSIGIGRDIT